MLVPCAGLEALCKGAEWVRDDPETHETVPCDEGDEGARKQPTTWTLPVMFAGLTADGWVPVVFEDGAFKPASEAFGFREINRV